MKKQNISIIIAIVLLLVGIYAIVADGFFSNSKIGDLNIVSPTKEWKVLYSTDSDFKVEIGDKFKKDTEICLIPKDVTEFKKGDKTKNVYNSKDELVATKTNKDKSIENKDGYCYSTTSEEYLKFGEHSTVLVYQDIKLLSYDLDWAQANITLYKNIDGVFDNTLNDIFVFTQGDDYKFGGNDSSNLGLNEYKYVIKSTSPIISDGNKPYIQRQVDSIWDGWLRHNNFERHVFDLSDICGRSWDCHDEIDGEGNTFQVCSNYSDCRIENYYQIIDENQTDYYLEVIFNSDKDIDPLISITEASSFTDYVGTDIELEQNYSHLSIDRTVAPYDSLVLYYNFDVNHTVSNNKTYDWSGMGNDGTVYYFGNITNKQCLFGNCYYNNGLKGWVHKSVLNVNKTLTYSLWFNQSVADAGPFISNTVQLKIQGNKPYIQYKNASSWETISSNYVISYNQWNYLALTINNGNLTFYYNNIIIYPNYTMNNSNYNTPNFYVFSDGGLEHLNGSIDEVMIFNTSLNASQISAIYNNQSSRFKSQGTQELKVQNISTGYQTVNLSLTDYLNSMNTNIAAKLGYWDITRGYKNYDFGVDTYGTFDGVNDYVSLTKIKLINNGTLNTTMTMWFYPVSNNAQSCCGLMTMGQSSPKIQGFALENTQASSKGLYWEIEGTSEVIFYYEGGGGTINLNKWNSLAWNIIATPYNSTCSNYTIKSYINGVANTQISRIARNASFSVDKLGNVYNQLNGSVDEIRIYNKSLTLDEILEINASGKIPNSSLTSDKLILWYQFNESDLHRNVMTDKSGLNNHGTMYGGVNFDSDVKRGLVLYYHFDNQSSYGENSTHVYDFSGMGNNGTAYNGVITNSTGVYSSAMNFDGVNDYINSTVISDVNLGKDFTIFAWVYKSGVVLGNIFSQSRSSANRFGISTDGTTTIIGYYNGTTYASASGIGYTDTWYHVVGIHYANDTNQLYINGILQTGTITLSSPGTGGTFRVGSGNNINYFNGSIDEVMIWNRSLSSNEVRELYTKGRLKYEYTAEQNLSTGTSNKLFSITNVSTHIYPVFRLLSDSYNFYSPILKMSAGVSLLYYEIIAPIINYNYLSLFDGTYSNSNNITLNVTYTEANPSNITYYLYNGSINTTGLVLYYSFDREDNNTQRVKDVSGNGYDGTNFNDTFWNSSGIFNGYHSFDATRKRIDTSKLQLIGNQSFTLSLWIYKNGGYSGASAYKGILAEDYHILYEKNSNDLGFYYGNIDHTTGYALPSKTWVLITVTYNMSNLSIYANNTMITSFSRTPHTTTTPSEYLRIGLYSNAPTYFNGSIDEVMIWNRSLSATEISALYNRSLVNRTEFATNVTSIQYKNLPSNQSYHYYVDMIDSSGNYNVTKLRTFTLDNIKPSLTTNPDNNSQTNRDSAIINLTTNNGEHYSFIDFDRSLVLYLRMDDINGTGHPTDISSYGNNVTAYGASQTESGYYGKAFNFDGVDDYVNINNNTVINNIRTSNNFSINVWVKPISNSVTNYAILQRGSAVTGQEIIIRYYNNPRFYVGFFGTDIFTPVNGNISLNNWYLLSFVWDYSSLNGSVYINGIIQSTATNSTALNTFADNLYLGVRESSGFSNYFNGSIDEVMIFNRSLSPNEIKSLYNSQVTRYSQNFSLSEGNHTFTAYAVDRAGNLNSSYNTLAKRNLSGDLVSTVGWVYNYPKDLNLYYTESNADDSDVNYTIYLDSILVSNNTFQSSLSVGTHNITLNTTGGEFYPAQEILLATMTVQDATLGGGGSQTTSTSYIQSITNSTTNFTFELAILKDWKFELVNELLVYPSIPGYTEVYRPDNILFDIQNISSIKKIPSIQKIPSIEYLDLIKEDNYYIKRFKINNDENNEELKATIKVDMIVNGTTKTEYIDVIITKASMTDKLIDKFDLDNAKNWTPYVVIIMAIAILVIIFTIVAMIWIAVAMVTKKR